MDRSIIAILVPVLIASSGSLAAADAGAGAKLVQANGCSGCHGATFQGGIGPKLYGIEHRLTASKIADAIKNPKSPMPKIPFKDAQIKDIVAYLSSIDGGGGQPVATLVPAKPRRNAVLSVRFPGPPPRHVTVVAGMQMGESMMMAPKVTLHPTSDPHVWTGNVTFSMGGPWTLDVVYDGKHLAVPVTVAGSM